MSDNTTIIKSPVAHPSHSNSSNLETQLESLELDDGRQGSTETGNNRFAEWSSYVREYLDLLPKDRPFKEEIETLTQELNLTATEEQLLRKFEDPITSEYAERPVILHGQYFDADSLAQCISELGHINPCNQQRFYPHEITDARRRESDLQSVRREIEFQRLTLSNPSTETSTSSSPNVQSNEGKEKTSNINHRV